MGEVPPVIVEFVIPGHPPSVNRVWRVAGKQVHKSSEYRAWEQMVAKICLAKGQRATLRELRDRAFRLEIIVVSDTWFTKKGDAIRKPDTPNFIKAAEDAVCQVYGWEDSFNIDTRCRKAAEEGSEDHTIIRFEFL